jgi:hypothetical protein
MGRDAVWLCRLLPTFGGTDCFYLQSTLKNEAIDSSEMVATIYQTIRRHIPQDRNLHNYIHKSLMSHIKLMSFK